MFRFTLGVVVGVVISRPLGATVGRVVLPFVVEKTLAGVSRAATYAADRLDHYSERTGRR